MDIPPEFDLPQVQTILNALKNICRDYPAGGSVLRELLQNADDAQATEVVCICPFLIRELWNRFPLNYLTEIHS